MNRFLTLISVRFLNSNLHAVLHRGGLAFDILWGANVPHAFFVQPILITDNCLLLVADTVQIISLSCISKFKRPECNHNTRGPPLFFFCVYLQITDNMDFSGPRIYCVSFTFVSLIRGSPRYNYINELIKSARSDQTAADGRPWTDD